MGNLQPYNKQAHEAARQRQSKQDKIFELEIEEQRARNLYATDDRAEHASMSVAAIVLASLTC